MTISMQQAQSFVGSNVRVNFNRKTDGLAVEGTGLLKSVTPIGSHYVANFKDFKAEMLPEYQSGEIPKLSGLKKLDSKIAEGLIKLGIPYGISGSQINSISPQSDMRAESSDKN